MLVIVVHEVDVEPQHVVESFAKREGNRLLVLYVKAGVERNFLIQEPEQLVYQTKELSFLVLQEVGAVFFVLVRDLQMNDESSVIY